VAGAVARRPFLTAQWRHLVMLSYEVDPAVLAPLVPAGTTLDAFEGRTLASVVGFRFLRTRLRRLPIPGHRSFDEVNLRFYVRREVAGQTRRGVVFVRELVPRRAIAWLARRVYHEPYRAVPMRSTLPASGKTPARLVYAWRIGRRWQHVAATAVGEAAVPADDSEAAFLTHHLWGYTRQADGGTVEYEVEHPRWSVWSAADPSLDADVAALYGPAFVRALAGPPRSALIADGSAVIVYRPCRLTD
jgi:uncharacterized protein YqjF (DUF2071 family)